MGVEVDSMDAGTDLFVTKDAFGTVAERQYGQTGGTNGSLGGS